jgi:glucose/arabinose dehydrogenase
MPRPAIVIALAIGLFWGPAARSQVVSNYVLGLDTPVGVEFDATGNLYVSSSAGSVIYKVGPGGAPVTPFVTTINNPMGMAMDAQGILHVMDSLDSLVWKVTPTGDKSVFARGIAWPMEGAFDAAGDLYVSEFRTGVVKRITPAGVVSVYVSGLHDGADTESYGVAFDPAGNLYVCVGTTIQKVGPGGAPVTTFASGLEKVAGIAQGADGQWYVANYAQNSLRSIPPTGGTGTLYAGQPPTSGCVNGPLLDARFTHPSGLRVRQDKLFVADNECNAVRIVDLSEPSPTLPMTWGRTKSLYR